MQVFNTFFKIAKKQIGSSMVYIVIFLVICVMMGSSGGQVNDAYSASRCKVLVVDNDKSVMSEKLVSYMSSIHKVDADSDYTKEEIQDRLYYGQIDYVLYIEKGYETSGELTNIKRSGTGTGIFIDSQISMYESELRALIDAGYSIDDAYSLTVLSLTPDNLVTMVSGQASKPVIYYFFTYVPYVMLMILFFMLTPAINAFNKKGVSDRLNVSPVSQLKKNIQLILGGACLSVIVWMLFIILASIIYDVADLSGKLGLIMLNSFVFMMVATAIVCFVADFALSGDELNVVANVVGLAMAFVGGIFVPLEVFGKGMLNAARFMPTYWYVRANDEIFSGGDLSDISRYVGVELLFAVAFLALTLVAFKRTKIAKKS